MEQYRICDVTQRPIPTLKTDSENFVSKWRAGWEARDGDIAELLSLAQPMILHWENLFTNPDYPKDINYISLCTLLSHYPSEALEEINKWLAWVTTYTTLREELTFLFIEHVRTSNYFPTYANPVMAEYVIADGFKKKLRVEIQKPRVKNHAVTDIVPEIEIPYLEPKPDYFLLESLDFTPWQNYLFLWMRTGRSLLDIAKVINTPRETFYYEEKEIWHLLRRTYFTDRVG